MAKSGGNFFVNNDAFAIMYYYMNTFVTLHYSALLTCCLFALIYTAQIESVRLPGLLVPRPSLSIGQCVGGWSCCVG